MNAAHAFARHRRRRDRRRGARVPARSRVADARSSPGFAAGRRRADGTRFRWTDGHASFFVPSGAAGADDPGRDDVRPAGAIRRCSSRSRSTIARPTRSSCATIAGGRGACALPPRGSPARAPHRHPRSSVYASGNHGVQARRGEVAVERSPSQSFRRFNAAIEIAGPGGPDVLRPVERPMPVAASRGSARARRGRRRQSARTSCSGWASIRRRRARPTSPASRSPARSCGAGADVTRWHVGRSRLRAGGGRRLRGILRRARAAVPADPERASARSRPRRSQRRSSRSGRTCSSGRRCGRRARADPRRHERHRHDGDPAGARVRRRRSSRPRASDAKCAACERLGATRDQLPDRPTSSQAVREATCRRGVDVVLDIVGGDYLQRNLDCLAMHGRLVQIGLSGSARAEINLARVMQKRLTITGSTLRARSVGGERRDRARARSAKCGRSSPAVTSRRSSIARCRWRAPRSASPARSGRRDREDRARGLALRGAADQRRAISRILFDIPRYTSQIAA